MMTMALEYAHHLQEVGIIENPTNKKEKEIIANDHAQRIVKVLIALGIGA